MFRLGGDRRFMNTTATLVLAVIGCAALAGDRFVSTAGTVQREIPADRLAMALELAATENTIEASVASLDHLLKEFGTQVATLGYPATAVTVKERKTQRVWEWVNHEGVVKGS